MSRDRGTCGSSPRVEVTCGAWTELAEQGWAWRGREMGANFSTYGLENDAKTKNGSGLGRNFAEEAGAPSLKDPGQSRTKEGPIDTLACGQL